MSSNKDGVKHGQNRINLESMGRKRFLHEAGNTGPGQDHPRTESTDQASGKPGRPFRRGEKKKLADAGNMLSKKCAELDHICIRQQQLLEEFHEMFSELS